MTTLEKCFFVSDLHGSENRYRALFRAIAEDRPGAVFIGGDILPHGFGALTDGEKDFIRDFLSAELTLLKEHLGPEYPRVLIILGNDDGRYQEEAMLDIAKRGLWDYMHNRCSRLGEYDIYGYSYVPPTPFFLKDWERYDVSRYVDPGCISPEEGRRSIHISKDEMRHATIKNDLEHLFEETNLDKTIILFHTPPYQTNLDRADLDGKMIDHVPLDVNVGSIAVRRFIEERRPLITLHGHVHESTRRTGSWKDRIGETYCFNAAHGGPELSLVRFDPRHPEHASRELLTS